MGDELDPAIALLVDAVRGRCPHSQAPGIPSAIQFSDQRLFDTLAPALAGLNIPATLAPEHSSFRALFASLAGYMGGPPDATEDQAAGTLEHWRQASLRLTEKLLDQVISGDLITPRAVKRYFGSHEEADEVLAELQHLGPFPSLLEWFITDYRATNRSKTLIEKLLAKQSLEPIERELLEARAATLPLIYRIDSITPGESLEAEDILAGERVTIHDISMSKCALEGTFVPLRLLTLEQWCIPLMAGPPLSALQINAAFGRLQALGLELTPAGLKGAAPLLGRLWSIPLQAEAPAITNTDGDELELQTANFHVDDRLPGPAPAPLGADQIDTVEGAMLEAYQRWVDSPVPAFGGITPRQACKSDKGAREVALMIRTIPPISTPFGMIQPPREKLLQMLGLE